MKNHNIKIYYRIPEIQDNPLVYEFDFDDPRILKFPSQYKEHKVCVSYRIANKNIEDDVIICNSEYQLRHFPKPESIKIIEKETGNEINNSKFMLNDELATIEFDESLDRTKIDIEYEVENIREEDGIFEIKDVRKNQIELRLEPKYESIRLVDVERNRYIPTYEYFQKGNIIKLNKKHDRKQLNVYYYPVVTDTMDECYKEISDLELAQRKVCKRERK